MTERTPPADDDVLAACLARALHDLDVGKPIDLLASCDGCAELVPQLAAALGVSVDVPALHRRSRETADDAPGLLAGRYRVQAPLGSGAAGTVYRARDERLQRDVAVKLLHRGLFAGDEAERRFHREALALAAHEHAHIVRIHDQGRSDDGRTFLVTELLRGRSLHAVLAAAQRALPDGPSAAAFADIAWLRELLPDAALESTYLRQIVRWMADLGEGLAAAHGNGICHRDVKPSNAFVGESGRIVLLDFGIAARAGDPTITHAHTVLGTPCYMAPEQAAGRLAAEPTLDVYGLGASLYHLLTNRPPHAGDLQQVLFALRSEEPVRASALHRGLPRDLQAILDRSLAKLPRHRYPTMAAMVADLRAFLAHLPVAARPLGPLARAWRRAVHAPARSLAIGSSLAAGALLAFALPAWSAVAAHARTTERAQRLASLAPDLCIEGRPEVLALVPLTERTDALAELDALLDLDEADLGVRVLRGLARLDAGDVAAARLDFAAIATAHGTPFLRALAAGAAAARASAQHVATLDPTGLPEPDGEQDCFVAGFLALRAGDCERADALLTRAAGYLPARDLRLLAILGLKKADPQRAFAEAKELEGVYGRPTARTRHTLGAALLQQLQFEAAIPYCEASLRLRPDRHGPLNNLALAHLRLGHLDTARRLYERAVELKPWLDNSRSGLCQTLRQLGDHDGARASALAMHDTGWREYELGNLELARAHAALAAGDRAAVQLAAQAAAAHFTAAGADATSKGPKTGSAVLARRIAEALGADHVDDALSPFLAALRGEPRNARQIASLAALLEQAEFDADSKARLRLWLLELAINLSPDTAEYRAQRDRLLESLRPR